MVEGVQITAWDNMPVDTAGSSSMPVQLLSFLRKSMLTLYSQPLSCILLTWLSCSLLPMDLHHFSCSLFGCPVSSSVETVCGWFPCTEMTRAKVRSFHDSFPLCCTQWMVFWVSHSDAKHRRDFLHMQAPRLRYALNQRNWVLNISLKFLCFFLIIS